MKEIEGELIYRDPGNDWERGRTTAGMSFEVIQDFEDADGDLHRSGECWTLLGTRFNKFENEVELGVRGSDGRDWLITLGWDEHRQQDIIARWNFYIRNRT
jgi:hypothetical protein